MKVNKWTASFIQKGLILGWAYVKIWWALIFTHNEFSPLLSSDDLVMSLMTNKQNEKYSLYLGKVRDRIGGHSYHQNLNQTL